MRKETSTNAVNERFLFKICKLNSSLSIIGGRWRAQIIFLISTGYDRFHLLEKELPNISQQVLGRQLKELEHHNILIKHDMLNTIPKGVQYVLTKKGNDLIPILKSLNEWGKYYEEDPNIIVNH